MSDNFNNNDFIYNKNEGNGSVEVFKNNANGNYWTYNYEEEIPKNSFTSSGVNNGRIVETKKSAKKNKHPFIKQMAATLVACLICSSVVGGVLTYNFSKQIDKQNAIIEQIKNNSNNYSSNLIGASYISDSKDISSIVAEVSPSVVGISIDFTIDSYNMRRSFFNFGPQQQTLEGSGIVLTQDGYIVTNYHVVSYADPQVYGNSNLTVDNMKVHFEDGTIAEATFIGGNEEKDLAVIKVNLNNLKPATLGDSSTLKAGDTAIAIGNPLGLDFAGTVTQGIVSAVNRSVETDEGIRMNLIQTDAAINQGNSGGALVNAHGEVIGINSAKISATGVEGIGFAISINDAKVIIDGLIK